MLTDFGAASASNLLPSSKCRVNYRNYISAEQSHICGAKDFLVNHMVQLLPVKLPNYLAACSPGQLSQLCAPDLSWQD